MEVVSFLSENKAVLLAFLFALSEVLALVPAVKANSVYQLVSNLVKKMLGKE